MTDPLLTSVTLLDPISGQHGGIAIAPNGSIFYSRDNEVSRLKADGTALTLVATLSAPVRGLVLNTAGTRLYATHTAASQVSTIDLTTGAAFRYTGAAPAITTSTVATYEDGRDTLYYVAAGKRIVRFVPSTASLNEIYTSTDDSCAVIDLDGTLVVVSSSGTETRITDLSGNALSEPGLPAVGPFYSAAVSGSKILIPVPTEDAVAEVETSRVGTFRRLGAGILTLAVAGDKILVLKDSADDHEGLYWTPSSTPPVDTRAHPTLSLEGPEAAVKGTTVTLTVRESGGADVQGVRLTLSDRHESHDLALKQGVASFAVRCDVEGTVTATVSYAGDERNHPSNSPSLSIVVRSPKKATPTVELDIPVCYVGRRTTVTARVRNATGRPVIRFYTDTDIFTDVQTVNGEASISVFPLTNGTCGVRAEVVADAYNHSASASDSTGTTAVAFRGPPGRSWPPRP